MARRGNQFIRLQHARQRHTIASGLKRKVLVNVFAIILDFGFPKITRRTDYCLNLRLVDDTYNKRGMAINIFTLNVHELPHVASAGDVIRLTQVQVVPHNEDLILVFNKSISSFALYKGKQDDDFVPYQYSSKFESRPEDKEFIAMLRKWWLVDFSFQEDPRRFPLLRELKEGFFNLACQILHCCEVAEGVWWIFIWDGTDAPPNAISAKLEDEIKSPLPLTAAPVPLPRELLCTFPTVGTILAVKFDRNVVKSQLHVLNVGKWVKFVNMEFKVHAGLWRGIFTPCTNIRYTPNEESLIMERQRLYEERRFRSLESGTIPFSCSLPNSPSVTEVKHESVLPVTLMEVLTHSEVTAKFKCVVRAVAVARCEPDDELCPRDEPCWLLLTLEDPTARIHACVSHEDWDTLFGGNPGIDVVTRKLNRLLGVNDESPRNPPWVSVCLKAFYTDKTDVWGSRKYRIFDTKIVGEA